MIPKNDITITPNKIHTLINDFFDIKIDHYSFNSEFVKLLSFIKDDLLSELSKTYIWQTTLLSYRYCEHKYGPISKKFGQLCGNKIDIQTEGNNYLCSIHISKKKYTPKKRIVDEETKCPALNMKGGPCGLRKKTIYNGYCKYHYQENKLVLLEKEIMNGKKVNLSNYVKDMITYHMDYDIMDYSRKQISKTEIPSDNFVKDLLVIEENILNNRICTTSKKFQNINSSVDSLYNETNILNNNIIQNQKMVDNLNTLKNYEKNHNIDIDHYLNNGIKIYKNDYINDIKLYDLYNGKKINTRKLIKKYKEIEKMYLYVKRHIKYYEHKKYNNNKCCYINEKDVIDLINIIILRIDKYKDQLDDFSPQTWIYLLNQLTNDIESYIIDFSNIDEKYKIYI